MKGQIDILTDRALGDRGPVRVDAEIFGAWAVHIAPDRWVYGRGKPKPALTITHVPTGLAARCSALVGISWRDARFVARRLNDAYPVLPHDVLDAATRKCKLSEASAATMRKLGEFIAELAVQANQTNRLRRSR